MKGMAVCTAFIIFCGISLCPKSSAQTSVPASFFGTSSSVCTPAQNSYCILSSSTTNPLYPIWWPGTSSPTVTLGSAGKSTNLTQWYALEGSPSTLYIAPSTGTDGSAYGFHWRNSLLDQGVTPSASGWIPLNSTVSAAQGSGVPVLYTYYQVPQYAVCYDYIVDDVHVDLYGGPNGSGGNPNAVSCPASGLVYPFNIIYSSSPGTGETLCAKGNNNGTGWCPGPGTNDKFGDLIEFAYQMVDQYAGYGTAGSGYEAINYFEIWNEPDATGIVVPPYWAPTVSGGTVPDWADLIKQTDALEAAINYEYGYDNVTHSTPIYVGPTIHTDATLGEHTSLCGSAPACQTTGYSSYGFLNTCPSGYNCGANYITVGSFHFYPFNDAVDDQGSDNLYGDSAACSNTLVSYELTSVECTGQTMIDGIQEVVNDFGYFGGITKVFMTEGGWMENADAADVSALDYVLNPTVVQDMRAYIARYALLMAATTSTGSSLIVNTQYWWAWAGDVHNPDAYGTGCDTEVSAGIPSVPPCVDKIGGGVGTPTYYAGYAYGQVYNWLAGGQITACTPAIGPPAPCTDVSDSIWALPVEPYGATSNTQLAVWAWANTDSVTCTSSGTQPIGCPSLTNYTHYETLSGSTYSLGSSPKSITITDEPKLLIP